jgi:deazaflavin-dependent oxidoreductase (nitroreductase family)
MTRLLRPLQRAFLVLNGGFMAPLLRSGLGWLMGNPATGWYLLLRTRGRRTGLLREAPLGYIVQDGRVYCVAGYGTSTPWFLNLLAEPNVEVILPTRRFRARAEPVEDPGEWLSAYRALTKSFGLLGRAVVGDTRALDDEALLDRDGALPVIRITPVEGERPLVAGPFDPGGRGWKFVYGGSFALGTLAWVKLAAPSRRRRRTYPGSPR